MSKQFTISMIIVGICGTLLIIVIDQGVFEEEEKREEREIGGEICYRMWLFRRPHTSGNVTFVDSIDGYNYSFNHTPLDSDFDYSEASEFTNELNLTTVVLSRGRLEIDTTLFVYHFTNITYQCAMFFYFENDIMYLAVRNFPMWWGNRTPYVNHEYGYNFVM